MKDNFAVYTIFIFISIIILVMISNILIKNNTLPSLSEFMASSTPSVNLATTTLSFSSTTIIVELASSTKDREIGLSGREKLDQNTGLLFLFDQPSRYGFWMKNMNFPIDIVWIDSDKKVSQIHSNIAPETYPIVFSPDIPVPYVLELNAGEASQFLFATGTQLYF